LTISLEELNAYGKLAKKFKAGVKGILNFRYFLSGSSLIFDDIFVAPGTLCCWPAIGSNFYLMVKFGLFRLDLDGS